MLGAAGGVGLTAVEVGKRLGARVIAVALGPEKLAVCRTAGADHLIDGGLTAAGAMNAVATRLNLWD